MITIKIKALVLAWMWLGLASTASSRTIFLNGQDISSAYGERLKGVDVYIDKNGDIFISGPQYKVIMESTRSPLSLAQKPNEIDGMPEGRDDLHRRMQNEASSRSKSSPASKPAEGERVRGVTEPATDDLPEMLSK